MKSPRRFRVVGSDDYNNAALSQDERSGDGGKVSCLDEANAPLEYIADLLLELQSMAIRSGAGTLAGIIMLAHDEAKRFASSRSS